MPCAWNGARVRKGKKSEEIEDKTLWKTTSAIQNDNFYRSHRRQYGYVLLARKRRLSGEEVLKRRSAMPFEAAVARAAAENDVERWLSPPPAPPAPCGGACEPSPTTGPVESALALLEDVEDIGGIMDAWRDDVDALSSVPETVRSEEGEGVVDVRGMTGFRGAENGFYPLEVSPAFVAEGWPGLPAEICLEDIGEVMIAEDEFGVEVDGYGLVVEEPGVDDVMPVAKNEGKGAVWVEKVGEMQTVKNAEKVEKADVTRKIEDVEKEIETDQESKRVMELVVLRKEENVEEMDGAQQALEAVKLELEKVLAGEHLADEEPDLAFQKAVANSPSAKSLQSEFSALPLSSQRKTKPGISWRKLSRSLPRILSPHVSPSSIVSPTHSVASAAASFKLPKTPTLSQDVSPTSIFSPGVPSSSALSCVGPCSTKAFDSAVLSTKTAKEAFTASHVEKAGAVVKSAAAASAASAIVARASVLHSIVPARAAATVAAAKTQQVTKPLKERKAAKAATGAAAAAASIKAGILSKPASATKSAFKPMPMSKPSKARKRKESALTLEVSLAKARRKSVSSVPTRKKVSAPRLDIEDVPSKDKCMKCGKGAKNTPMMRKGPDGSRSMCNACGLRWARHGVC